MTTYDIINSAADSIKSNAYENVKIKYSYLKGNYLLLF